MASNRLRRTWLAFAILTGACSDHAGSSMQSGATDPGTGGGGAAPVTDGVPGTGGSTGMGAGDMSGATGSGGQPPTVGTTGSGGATGTSGATGGGMDVDAGTGGVGAIDSGAGEMSTGGTGGAGISSGAMPSAGCGKSPMLTSHTQSVPAGFGVGGRYSIQSGGQERTFIIRLPDNYDNHHPYWLIFGFHWNGGLADDVDSGGTSKYEFSYYGLQKRSNNGAIFVAPQGINNGWANSGGQDLTFTDDMVQLIEDDLCVDTTHVISTGFSYGAGMSYAIACARAKVFDAVVLYEGMQLSGCEGGGDPIAYMQLAGLADTTTVIDNARPMRDRFVENNGCTPQDPPEPAQGSLTHICTSYAGCSSRHPVVWCAHGSGHTPAPVDGSSSLVDGINTWAPAEVWMFLTGF
jgi:poly(3-hydroxybutyrate) depolymerase